MNDVADGTVGYLPNTSVDRMADRYGIDWALVGAAIGRAGQRDGHAVRGLANRYILLSAVLKDAGRRESHPWYGGWADAVRRLSAYAATGVLLPKSK